MKENSRTFNSVRNSVIGLICQLSVTITNFIVRTVFIYHLSSEYLGINGLFTNILTVLNFAELGFGNAIIFSMYKPIANNDTKKVKSLMYFFKKIYIIIGIFVLISGLLIIPFLDFIIKSPPKINENLIIIYLLYLLEAVLSYFYCHKKSLLLAYQKNHINNLYELYTVIAKSIIQIIILITTKNYILYLFTYVISTLVVNILISNKADKIYPEIKNENIEKLDKKEIKKIFSDVKSLILYKFGKTINNGTDNLLISSLIGIKEVGLYSNYSLILQAVKHAFKSMINGVTGSVGNLNTSKDLKKRQAILEQLLLISVWIFGFASICLLILLKPFISLWIGNDYILDFKVVLAIVIIFYLEGTNFIAETYRDTCGLFKKGKIAPLICAIINIILSIILGKKIGLMGIFIATIISLLLTTTWYNPYIIYKNIFKKSPTKYYLKYILYTLITIVAYLICDSICNSIKTNIILGFIIKSIITIIISNLIFFIFSFWNKDFIKIKNKIINIIRR